MGLNQNAGPAWLLYLMNHRNPAVQAKSKLIANRTKQPKVLHTQTLNLNLHHHPQLKPQHISYPHFQPAEWYPDTIRPKKRSFNSSDSSSDHIRRVIFDTKTIKFNISNLQNRVRQRQQQLQTLRCRYNTLYSIYLRSKPQIRSPIRHRESHRQATSPLRHPTSPQLRKQRRFMRQDTNLLVRMFDGDKSETSDTESTENLIGDYQICKEENDRLMERNQELKLKIEEIRRLREGLGGRARIMQRIGGLELENRDLHGVIDMMSKLIKEDAERRDGASDF